MMSRPLRDTKATAILTSRDCSIASGRTEAMLWVALSITCMCIYVVPPLRLYLSKPIRIILLFLSKCKINFEQNGSNLEPKTVYNILLEGTQPLPHKGVTANG